MLKTNKSKKNVVILALSVMLAIAALFGATAAWFTAKDSASGTVKTGTLAVSLLNSEGADLGEIAVTGAAAGDNILVGAKAKVETTLTAGAYLRVKVEIKNGQTAYTATIADAENKWSDEVGGYYYYGEANSISGEEKLTVVNGTTTIALPSFSIPTTANNSMQDATLNIEVTVEVIQAANVTDALLTEAWAAVATNAAQS